MNKKFEENVIQDEIYVIPIDMKLKIIICSLVLTLTGLLMNLPVLINLEEQIETAIKSYPNCQISYKKLDLSYLLPKLTLKRPTIPGNCFNNPTSSLKLDSIDTSFTIPSFIPPGLKFHSVIKGLKSEINIYPRVSAGAVDIRITKSKVNAKLINALTIYPNLLNGHLDLEGFFATKKNKLDSGVAKLSSKNLIVPAQTINFFEIPELILNKLNLVIKINKNKLSINQLLIGNESAPIRAEIKGTVTLNQRAMNLSLLNLQGKVKFSPEFMKSFAIMEMMLAKAKPVDGFYNFTLTGTPAAPKPTFK